VRHAARVRLLSGPLLSLFVIFPCHLQEQTKIAGRGATRTNPLPFPAATFRLIKVTFVISRFGSSLKRHKSCRRRLSKSRQKI
jgi:hypothetical protein